MKEKINQEINNEKTNNQFVKDDQIKKKQIPISTSFTSGSNNYQ